MKILFVTSLYPPFYVGGYEIRCKETVEEFRNRGHQAFVLTGRPSNRRVEVQDNIYVYRALFSRPVGKGENLFSKNIFSELKRRFNQFLSGFENRKNYQLTINLLQSLRPDLVFVWSTSNVGLGPVLASQAQGIPVVFSVGDYSLLDIKLKAAERIGPIKKYVRSFFLGIRDFDQLDTRHILAISAELKRIYVEYGFPRESITVIPRGIHSRLIVSSDSFTSRQKPDKNGIKLLFVGRLVPEKGPDIAIRAFDIFVKTYKVKNAELDILGEGNDDYVSKLQDLVSNLGRNEAIKFLGRLKHSDVLNLYAQYDVLLFPSRWYEPLGGTVLEAMARGLPVIASKRGGPLDIIQDGVNGMLVPAEDPVEFAKAVHRITSDFQLWNQIRFLALDTMRREYTLEKVSDKILNYFQKIIAIRL